MHEAHREKTVALLHCSCQCRKADDWVVVSDSALYDAGSLQTAALCYGQMKRHTVKNRLVDKGKGWGGGGSIIK